MTPLPWLGSPSTCNQLQVRKKEFAKLNQKSNQRRAEHLAGRGSDTEGKRGEKEREGEGERVTLRERGEGGRECERGRGGESDTEGKRKREGEEERE